MDITASRICSAAAFAALTLTACGGPLEPQPQIANPDRVPAGRFLIDVDPDTGDVTVNRVGTTELGLHVPANVVQNDRPGMGPAESYEVVTSSAVIGSAGNPSCPAGNNCFDVAVRSFLSRPGFELTMVIDSSAPLRSQNNSDAPPTGSGLATGLGLTAFGDVAARGITASEQVRITIPNRQYYKMSISLYERDVGCADQTREGFGDLATATNIAACAGGWSVPGLRTNTACDRISGNSNIDNPNGAACGAADLCAPGWHVCSSVAEVVSDTPAGTCTGILIGLVGTQFFATQVSGNGSSNCGPTGLNDLFGCGNLGATTFGTGCGPLVVFSNNLCTPLGPSWTCPAANSGDINEAAFVTKPNAASGGVLCCRD